MNINIYAFPVCDCAHDGDGMCAEDEVCKHCYCLPKGIKIFLKFYRINKFCINIISASQCRCGIERPDTYKDFNRVIGGKEVTKVGDKASQFYLFYAT